MPEFRAIDMQETSATEVCVSSFSFFLEEKVGRETLKIGKDCRKVCAPGFLSQVGEGVLQFA